MEVLEYYVAHREKQNYIFGPCVGGERPSWIKMKGKESGVRFLKVETPKSRCYYNSFFGQYFMPEHAVDAELKAFYDQTAELFDHDMQDHALFGQEFLLILKRLGVTHDANILSVCCGTGLEMSYLQAAQYRNLWFNDVSDRMIEICRRKYGESCHYVAVILNAPRFRCRWMSVSKGLWSQITQLFFRQISYM